MTVDDATYATLLREAKSHLSEMEVPTPDHDELRALIARLTPDQVESVAVELALAAAQSLHLFEALDWTSWLRNQAILLWRYNGLPAQDVARRAADYEAAERYRDSLLVDAVAAQAGFHACPLSYLSCARLRRISALTVHQHLCTKAYLRYRLRRGGAPDGDGALQDQDYFWALSEVRAVANRCPGPHHTRCSQLVAAVEQCNSGRTPIEDVSRAQSLIMRTGDACQGSLHEYLREFIQWAAEHPSTTVDVGLCEDSRKATMGEVLVKSCLGRIASVLPNLPALPR
jgi:hypothetical protein